MPAGKKDQRVTIQAKQVTRDQYGAEVITWITFAERWAEVTPLAGREYVSMRQSQSDITTRMVINWLPGIATGMRVIWEEVPHAIIAAIPTGRRWAQEIELQCVAERTDMVPESLHG